MVIRRWWVAAFALLWSHGAQAAPTNCAERLMPVGKTTASAVTTRSLVELRDFGGSDNRAVSAPPFALSPDGQWIALVLRRADTDTDQYCHGVVLINVAARQPPRLLDVGGDFISMAFDNHGIPDMPSGSPANITPIWSPDGRMLAYLRRDKGITQAWTVALDGKPARQRTHAATDAREIAWSSDGRQVLVTSRPGVQQAQTQIDLEGRTGFHFDKRFWPLSEDRPAPDLPIPTEMWAYDIAGDAQGHYVDATTASADAAKPLGAYLYAQSTPGMRAWTIKTDPNLFIGPAALHIEEDGAARPCPTSICAERVAGIWWVAPRILLFARSGSPTNGGKDALYRWDLDHERHPRLLLETEDAFFGCQLGDARLFCAIERATAPRAIFEIDVRTGKRRLVFNPNADFPVVGLGQVRRLRWDAGARTIAYGDLVLPPGHSAGERHPLIVVQYESRGFLRGGTGDTVPIFPLAAHGYAVLSTQRPPFPPAAMRGHSFDEFQRENIKDFSDRRRLAASVQTGVDAAIALGLVDPDRVGLTGMSDGAATAQFLLAHDNRFRAVSLSSCCDDASTSMFAVGIDYRDSVLASGYPKPGVPDVRFWQEYSIAPHALTIKAPLLLQLSDREFRLGLETFNALQVSGAPVDMYVFPDEYHVKWHPGHRLAEYDRTVAWFDFWLRGQEFTDPGRSADLQRWRKLKAAAVSGPSLAVSAQDLARPSSSTSSRSPRPSPSGSDH